MIFRDGFFKRTTVKNQFSESLDLSQLSLKIIWTFKKNHFAAAKMRKKFKSACKPRKTDHHSLILTDLNFGNFSNRVQPPGFNIFHLARSAHDHRTTQYPVTTYMMLFLCTNIYEACVISILPCKQSSMWKVLTKKF